MRKLIFILIALVSFSQAQTIQYIGAPTTTVISKGNFRTDSIFYLPKRTKLPTDTAAFRYQISDSSLYVWSGYQWLRAGGSGSINGTLTTNYIPKATGTATIGNSLLYTSGNNLMFNSTTPYTTNSGWSTSEVNATSVALNVWKINDTARGYIAHNGTLMEINNLRNGDLTFVTNSSTRGRFTSTGDFRVNTLGGTGSRVVVASSNGTLSASSSATDLIDTTYISSRAWRQKGVDSVQFNVGLKVNISDTSTMLSPYIRHAGYGLTKSSQSLSVDTALMATRLRVGKVVDSLSLVKQNVLTNPVTGTGTSGYIPKWNGTTTQTNSLMYDNGSGIGINTTSPNQKLTIQSGVGDVAGVTFRANGLTSSDEVFVGQGSSGSAFISNRSTNSITFQIGGFTRMNLTNDAELFVNTTSDAGDYKLQVAGNILGTGTLNISGSTVLANSSGDVGIGLIAAGQSGFKNLEIGGSGVSGLIDLYQGTSRQLRIYNSGTDSYLANVTNGGGMLFRTTTSGGTQNNNLFITSSGEILINTTTDAGAYTLQNNGALYNTGGALLSATSGNVGIGQIPTYSKFQIYSPTATQVGLSLFTGLESAERTTYVANEGLQLSSYQSVASSPFTKVSDIVANGDGTSAAIMRFWTKVSGSSSPVEAMRINSAQETLFGTTTDAGAYRVQVNGATYISKTDGGEALVILGNSNTASLQQNGSDLYFNTNTNTTGGGFYFRNTSSYNVLMNLTSSGELLVGTTTDAGNYRVQVNGNAYVSDRLSVATTSTNASIVSYNATNSIFSLLTNGEIYNREVGSSASNNTVEVHIRPYAGKSGYLTFTENAVADRWAIGIQNGNSGLRFLTGGALGTETIKFQTNGGIRYVPQSAAPTAEAGTVYYDSDDNKLKVYNGTTWVDLH